MKTRGRPPHPDVLTPKEWEVLELLREDLTNEEIAERLSVTLDGAKYHVSQILSKLYVNSRKEAALWRPQEPRQWWRMLLPLPIAAKAAGVAVISSTVIGLGALAVLATQVDTSEDSINLPPPVGDPALTREQILIRVGQIPHGEPLELTVQPSTSGAILAFLESEPAEVRTELFDADPDSTAWLVSLRGVMTQGGSGTIIEFDRAASRARTLHKLCRDVHMAFLEDETPPAIVVGVPLPESSCRADQMTEDLALVYAASSVPGIIKGTAHNIAVSKTTTREVPELVEELGLDPSGPFADILDYPVWVATIDGEFVERPDLTGLDYDSVFDDTNEIRKCGTAKIVVGSIGGPYIDERPCP